MILGMMLGRGTYWNHISWLSEQPWEGYLSYIMHRIVFIKSKDGVIRNRWEQEGQMITERKSTYCHLPIHTSTMHQMLFGDNI